MDLVVEQFETKHKGLGLRAKKFIKKGSIVLEEAPFAYAVNEGKKHIYCNNCLKKKPLKSCSSCKQAFYCSTNCQRSMWNDHKHECSTFKHTAGAYDALTTAMVVFRTLRRIKRNPNIYSEKEEGNLRSLVDLKSNDGFDWLDDITDVVYSNLKVLKKNGCNLFSNAFSSSEGIRRLVGKITTNYHVITDEEMCFERGCGLYLNCSLINHDCEPNCFPSYKTPDIHIRAVRDIEPGEEITIPYCELPGCKQMKQDLLHFECKCDGCNRNKHEKAMLRDRDGNMMKRSEVDSMIKDISYLTTLADRMEISVQAKEVVDYGNSLLKERNIAPDNIFAFKIMLVLIPAYFSMNEQAKALELHRRTLPLYKKWTSVSAPLGHMHSRVAILLMLAEKFVEAQRFFTSALSILHLTHGKNSELVQQTMTSYDYCEAIIRTRPGGLKQKVKDEMEKDEREKNKTKDEMKKKEAKD